MCVRIIGGATGTDTGAGLADGFGFAAASPLVSPPAIMRIIIMFCDDEPASSHDIFRTERCAVGGVGRRGVVCRNDLLIFLCQRVRLPARAQPRTRGTARREPTRDPRTLSQQRRVAAWAVGIECSNKTEHRRTVREINERTRYVLSCKLDRTLTVLLRSQLQLRVSRVREPSMCVWCFARGGCGELSDVRSPPDEQHRGAGQRTQPRQSQARGEAPGGAGVLAGVDARP